MKEYTISSININTINDGILKKHFFIMDKKKQAETVALPSDIKKKQKIAADMLCRQMIADKCGISLDSIVFDKNKNGKPFAVNSGVFFSVSHCVDTVVCAISENEIGIDTEKIRSIRLRIAEKFATEAELEYIGDDVNRFFEIWTLKEAFFKCKGTGLGSDIKSVGFSVDGAGITCSESGYKLCFEKISDGYVCSVCIKK